MRMGQVETAARVVVGGDEERGDARHAEGGRLLRDDEDQAVAVAELLVDRTSESIEHGSSNGVKPRLDGIETARLTREIEPYNTLPGPFQARLHDHVRALD